MQPPFRASAHLTSHNAGRRRWRPGAFDQRGCVQPPPHASVGATEKRRPRGKNRSSCDWHSTVQIQETVRSAARLVQLNYPSNFSRRVCRPINRVNLSAGPVGAGWGLGGGRLVPREHSLRLVQGPSKLPPGKSVQIGVPVHVQPDCLREARCVSTGPTAGRLASKFKGPFKVAER